MTLIEVLIGLVILSIISVMMANVLLTVSESRKRILRKSTNVDEQLVSEFAFRRLIKNAVWTGLEDKDYYFEGDQSELVGWRSGDIL